MRPAVSGNNPSSLIVHVPKNDVETRHKVVRFGRVFESGREDEENLYRYLHQRHDLRVSKGSIPVGFESYLPLAEGHSLFLETRSGGCDDYGQPIGPEYQVTYKKEREVLAAGEGDGWNGNLDDLWTSVLSHFERKNMLSEETLDYLDADPFVLFGIDDPVTQQALRKLARYPCLICMGQVPVFDEWAAYLRIDPDDVEMKWLVQAFSETDLPKPWTCYKGVGSIVCYIRSDTGQVTWKHPFYDYFRQLRDFCAEANENRRFEEVMKVRVNRLLWTYEATRVETDHEQEPLLSPEYLSRLADIFGYDIKVSGCIVRNLKAQLKIFARSYRQNQDVDMADVINCAETLQRDVEKYAEMQDHWMNRVKEDTRFDLTLLSNGELQCVNCGTIALCFCLECKDYLCLNCYDALHCKGSRTLHAPFRLVPCGLCVTKPAKLHCTFTDKSLCHKCYAMDHIKQLPDDGKENQPRRIDYIQQYNRYAEFARQRNAQRGLKDPQEQAAGQGNHGSPGSPGSPKVPGVDFSGIRQEDNYEAVLSTDWHPFYDARGVKFYWNFVTGERMRQSPRRVPNTADPGAESVEAETLENGDLDENGSGAGTATEAAGFGGFTRTSFNSEATDSKRKTQPLPLEGFDALETNPLARKAAATLPDLRNLRPPHRTHQPLQSKAL